MNPALNALLYISSTSNTTYFSSSSDYKDLQLYLCPLDNPSPTPLSLTMTTLQPSNTRAEKLVALPSLSCGLSSLPQAKSMDSVSLHPNMYAQRAAQSEAKVFSSLLATRHSPLNAFFLSQLKNVLSKTASNSQNPPPIPAYMNPVRDISLITLSVWADRCQFFFGHSSLIITQIRPVHLRP